MVTHEGANLCMAAVVVVVAEGGSDNREGERQ